MSRDCATAPPQGAPPLQSETCPAHRGADAGHEQPLARSSFWVGYRKLGSRPGRRLRRPSSARNGRSLTAWHEAVCQSVRSIPHGGANLTRKRCSYLGLECVYSVPRAGVTAEAPWEQIWNR